MYSYDLLVDTWQECVQLIFDPYDRFQGDTYTGIASLSVAESIDPVRNSGNFRPTLRSSRKTSLKVLLGSCQTDYAVTGRMSFIS